MMQSIIYILNMIKKIILSLLFIFLQVSLLKSVIADDTTPPPEIGKLGRTAPGGSSWKRSIIQETGSVCGLSQKPLTALIPENLIGLTVNDYPTFLVYIPTNSAQKAFFELKDETGKIIYKISVKNPHEIIGVFSLNIPNKSEKLALEIGKNYKWTFTLICNFRYRSQDLIVGGSIQRVKLTQETIEQLRKASKRDRPAIYGKAGIWHEALTELAELRRLYPQDKKITNDWQKILKQVKLDDIAEEPLVQPQK